MAETHVPTVRVILWTSLRCTATVFTKSISCLDRVKIVYEMYSDAYYFGEERLSPRYHNRPPIRGISFKDVQSKLTGTYTEYNAVFCKELAFCVKDKFDVIPPGFRHSFLIRNPSKAVMSLYKLVATGSIPEYSTFLAEEVGFREMWELYVHLQNGHKPVVVVDSDDLLKNPKAMMKLYCSEMGLVYSDNMLSWEAGTADFWEGWENDWFSTVDDSTGFMRPLIEDTSTSQIQLPEDIQRAIADAQIYYDKLYSRRLIV